MDSLAQDVRYAVRMLLRRPTFAVVAVGAVALGIGANAAIVGVVKTALAERLPFRDVERLVMIWQQDLPNDRDRITLAMAEYEAYRTSRALTDVAAARPTAFTATIDRTSTVLQGARVTVNLLRTLGATPVLGRDFHPEEDRSGRHLVAMISHGLWLRQFGGAATVVGRTVLLDEAAAAPGTTPAAGGSRAPYTIVGVLPSGFEIFYTQADVVTPMNPVQLAEQRSVRGLRVVARLAHGTTHESASADVKAIDRRIAAIDAQPNRGTDVVLIPLRDEEVGDIRPTMIALSAGAALVLLIAGANVSNMLLARITERSREIVTRAALGASSRRLARQLVTESLVLNALGAFAGVLLARWTIDAVAAYAPAELMRLSTVRMDWQMIGIAIVLSALTALFCSAGPAWRISRDRTITTVMARSTPPPEHDRVRRILVASQVALAVVALTGAALVAMSFMRLRDAALGFQPQNVLTWRVAPPASRYADPPARSALYRRVLERLADFPGIESAGAINILPITDADQSMPLTAPGSSATDPAHPAVVKFRAASPGYFEALGIPVLRGRDFRDIDVDAGMAVVSGSLARVLWGTGAEVINRQVAVHLGPNRSRTLTIVGMVGDVRQFRDTPPQPTIYVSSLGQSAMTFVLRSRVAHESIVHSVRGVLTEVDSELAAYDIRLMNERLEQAGPFTTGRFRAAIGIAFGAACLLLAIMGVHGVVRYAVARQTREIGVRIAIGATAREIVRLIVVRHLVPVIAGLAVGLAGAVATLRVLAGYLYDVAPTNPIVLVFVPSILLLIAALAAWLPARRAACISPLVALHQD